MTFDKGPVLVLGAASWNRMVYVPALPQGSSATIFNAREIEAVGSTGVGKSMVLAALGCAPSFHCALGNDDAAHEIVTACTARGIEIIVDVQDVPTPRHLNIMDEAGGRYSIFVESGADDPVVDEQRIAPLIAQAETIFLSLASSSSKLLHLLDDTQAEILVDLHDYDGVNPWYDAFIERADVLQVSDVALQNPQAAIDRLLGGRARQVVLTMGSKGAEIFTDRDRIAVNPCKADMRDSNGAGDAFSVALWFAQKSGLNLNHAGSFASAAAAIAIEDAALFPERVSPNDILWRAGLQKLSMTD